MHRQWTASAQNTVIIAGLVLSSGLSAGCATVEAESEARPKEPAASEGRFGTASDRAKLEACYADAKRLDPGLSVHTVALFFARDGKLVFVDVELPETPKLARCLADAVLSSNAFEAPVAQGPGSIASGGLRIDLGPPLARPGPRPTLAETRARHRRATVAALEKGALRASDPMVRELLDPAPLWPTTEMRAELDECHREALRSHPGLVLHREVIYLSRGSQVLLGDVSIPEAPELQRCVLKRVAEWPSPFSRSSEGATLSGFFVHLGAPEEFPEPPASLTAELDRRRALVRRALELGLIEAADPLLEQFSTASPR
jgi:hypothetical protein